MFLGRILGFLVMFFAPEIWKNGQFVLSLLSLRKHLSVATDTRIACFRRMHRKLPTHASLASDE